MLARGRALGVIPADEHILVRVDRLPFLAHTRHRVRRQMPAAGQLSTPARHRKADLDADVAERIERDVRMRQFPDIRSSDAQDGGSLPAANVCCAGAPADREP